METAQIGDRVKLSEDEAELLGGLDKRLRKTIIEFWKENTSEYEKQRFNMNNCNATVLATMLADLVAYTSATENTPISKTKGAVLNLLESEIDRRYALYLKTMGH